MASYTREYWRLRRLGWVAVSALDAARVKADFDDATGKGLVRLKVVPDDAYEIDDLAGDTFNPKANPNIPPARLERERKAFAESVDRNGVWGIVGEYFDGEQWQHGDSVWGFVGENWQDSGYDRDVMALTLDALHRVKLCSTCGRPNRRGGQ